MTQPELTIQQFKLPLTKQMINWLGKGFNRFGINPVKLSTDSLLKAACRQIGLSDWGEDHFHVPLQTLLDSLDKEANLNLLGRISLRKTCLRLLINRLCIQENFKQHPEIREIPIRRPLFIVGLPRTGTTLLHNLMAQDPVNRTPLLWELLYPSPFSLNRTYNVDCRIKLTTKKINQFYKLAPQIFSIHPYNPTGPEECLPLFQNRFESYYFVLYYQVPKYTKWLLNQNMVTAYRYYLSQLQLLHWQRPGERWVLKSPAHLYSLDALLAVFPDACLVQMHRDPQEVIPSVCSLSGMAVKMSGGEINLKYLGEKGLFLCKTAVDRAMNVRETVNLDHFYDADYQDLLKNPIDVMHRIYEYFGYELNPQMEEGMRNWLRENPQRKYGVHHYSLDAFGLDKKTIDTQFALYMEKNRGVFKY